jgi:hypothetical protein
MRTSSSANQPPRQQFHYLLSSDKTKNLKFLLFRDKEIGLANNSEAKIDIQRYNID